MNKMKDSGIEWIGDIPVKWNLIKAKRFFINTKRIVGTDADKYDRLALTLNGVIKRSKDDSEGLQPEKFEGYQILHKNELVFKLIDLENEKTSRVGLSPYTGIVSPAYIVLSNNFDDNRFFYYWFMFMYYNEVFNHLGGEGVRSALNAKDVLSLPVPDINSDEQHCIADYLDRKCSQIDSIIAKQQEVIEKLKEYKMSVITEAVTKGLNPDVPMKDSGVDWIGKIPQFTTITYARRLYEIILGKMLSPTAKSGEDTLESYFCAANVHFSDIEYNNLKTMWFSQEERNNYLVKLGDLLVVEGGAGAGGAHIVEKSVGDCYIQNSIMIARSKSSVSNKWLYYTLYSLVKRAYVDFICNKATIPHFTKDKLGNTPIVLFPKEIEETIIVFLDKKCSSIDRQILQKEKVIKKLTEYKKSLIYEVVTGKKEV